MHDFGVEFDATPSRDLVPSSLDVGAYLKATAILGGAQVNGKDNLARYDVWSAWRNVKTADGAHGIAVLPDVHLNH